MSMRSFDDADQAVSIIAILFFIRAAFDGVPLLGTLFGGGFTEPLVLLAVAVVAASVAAGVGLLKGQRWAWPLAFAVAVLAALQSLLSLPVGIISLLFDALILYLLFRPAVRERFGQLRQS